MTTLEYYYYSIGILLVYLVILFFNKQYRLILPSTSFCVMWLITCVLIVFQVKGYFVSSILPEQKVALVARFTFFMCVSSIIGFALSHMFLSKSSLTFTNNVINADLLEYYLYKFRWIPYFCGIVGFSLLIFIIYTIGSIDSFSDYRVVAIYTERVGYAKIAQRISGHINILGMFYLMLYGYVSGQKGINIKHFIWIVFLCSLINMSIGGRVWIITSLLPFVTTYLLSIFKPNPELDLYSSNRKLLLILIICVSLFSILGTLRSDEGDYTFIDKFLYLTDGSKMTNLMLGFYPEDTYDLEYGRSTLLNGFIDSPMKDKFAERISDNIGLSVTVKSILPNLYYDFGIYGGAIFMGFLCFALEIICMYFRYSSSVLGLICYGTIAGFLVQSPVGNVFALYTPICEWISIIFIFRKWIFNKGITEFDNN